MNATAPTPGPTPGPTPAPDPLDDRIAYLVTRTRSLADGVVAPPTLATLDRLTVRRTTPAVRAVVVGEVSRGKSTLINALIGRTLLPDAAAALTATWTLVSHGTGLTARAHVATGTGVEQVLLDRTDLDAYLTVGGERLVRRRHGTQARVASVEIRLDAPVLAGGLELIDTPGVGGLAAAHRYATLAALGEADAVLFTLKPGEPVSATERRFLAEAVKHLDTCLIVQTQRDLAADPDRHLADDMDRLRSADAWEKLLGDPAEAAELAAYFARTKSVSVSALNALRAAADPTDPVNVQLHRQSGIPTLVELLNDVVGRGHAVHRRNLLRLVESVARECRNRLRDRVEMLSGSAAGQQLLDERAARVAKWTTDDGAHWRSVLDEVHRELVAEVTRHARRRAEEIDDDYRSRLRDLKTAEIVAETKGMLALPDAVLAELSRLATDAVTDGIARIRRLLVDDRLDGSLSHLGATRAVFSRLPDGFEAMAGPGDPNELRVTLSGGVLAAGAVGLGVTALANAAIAVVAAPIVIPFLIGAGATYLFNRRSREQKRTLQGALDTLRIVCDEIRNTAAPAVLKNAEETKAKLATLIEAGLTELAEQVRQDQEDLRRTDGLTPAERQARLVDAQQGLRDAEDVLQAAAALRGRIG
ncbi:dynamin family protein [Kitasatospora sp. LaBMicrA B282]|uniref:dynamin family protein n=1 Tax=Kitasatospora sp. LaBMicrA B282 TaxID=3420949 RepID=UPI003D0ADBF8